MELPGSPVVKDSEIPLQGAWVQPLVGELTSSQKEKERKKVISSKIPRKVLPISHRRGRNWAGPHR